MRQKIILLSISLLMLVTHFSFAQKITNADLRKVIVKFKENNCLEAENSEKVLALGSVKDTAIYIVEFQNGGFMIISANYSAPPVLGYCSNGIYDPKNMPEGLIYLIGTYQKNILYIKENNIKPSIEATSLWNNYLKKDREDSIKLKNTSSVEKVVNIENFTNLSNVLPLIQTKWQQGDIHQTGHPRQQTSYNKFCPTGCYAGCGAIAMAQILNYWKWNINQTGSNTFDGQTVNFGNYVSYCWENMALNYPNDFNAKLIYHAGVSCNTDYCKSESASQSILENVLYGFKNYWGMSLNADIKRRLWIMVPSWSNRLKEELNNGRPIFYAGGEHSWVIDGYSEIGFHCNWGAFDGNYDDYYYLGDFNLPGVDYNSDEYAIFNLQPATNVINSLLGPDIVTSTPVTYYIQNIADCKYATWVITPNLQNVYGSNHWTVVKAIGSGIGWIDGTYVLDGVIHNAPRKYVTCIP